MTDVAPILAATDLAALIGETVRLKKQGQQLYGLCPLHTDKSPSLRVDPKKQLWHCPVCQLGGDAITWLRKRDGIGFREAADDLAKRAGIAPGAARSAPMPIKQPSAPKYPKPAHEPVTAWGGQHLMRGRKSILILNEFPGRARYREIAAENPDTDVIWFPRNTAGMTAGAEEMHLAPIARQATEVEMPDYASPTFAWEYERRQTLERLIQRWRGYAMMARPAALIDRSG